jgi:feruloyl esterase
MTASTDTAIKVATRSGIGHPEKVTDFAFRAVHEMTVESKAIVAGFYDRAPATRVLEWLFNRGRQGLMEAQKYPEDFLTPSWPALRRTIRRTFTPGT